MSPAPLDRRAFVQASAATVSAALLAGTAHARSRGCPQDTLRVALLGCGGRGTGAASDALTADANAVLVALGDVLPRRIESAHENLSKDPALASRLQVPPERRFIGFDALERILAEDVDVVLLATPPCFRPGQLAACVAAGKHVFAEKPMAVDAPGVRSAMESSRRARERGLALVSGFCWRSSFPERESYARIHDGWIGELRTAYATYNAVPNLSFERQPGMSDMEWQILNWFHFLWLGGDHIVEQACHSVDKLNWAFQNEPPQRCWAVGGRAQRRERDPGNVFDHFSVTWEYSRDRRALLLARQWDNCPTDNSDWVYGEKGIARINGWAPEHWIRGEQNWEYEGDRNAMYVEEHEELFAGIRSGKPRNDGEWMCQSTLMSIMGRMAAYTGRAVTWEQALASEESLMPATLAMGPVPITPVPRPGFAQRT